MEKSPEIEGFLERLSKNFAMARSVAARDSKCAMCGGDAADFRNALSKKEYEISKMCQECQDRLFGVE